MDNNVLILTHAMNFNLYQITHLFPLSNNKNLFCLSPLRKLKLETHKNLYKLTKYIERHQASGVREREREKINCKIEVIRGIRPPPHPPPHPHRLIFHD